MTDFWTWLLSVIGALVTIATLGRLIGVQRIPGIFKRIGFFLDDWNGELARPGHDAVPSFPERMSEVEKSLSSLVSRVTDHRKRNDEQIKVLQAAVEELQRLQRQHRSTDKE